MNAIPFGKIASAGNCAANDDDIASDDITSSEEHRRKQDAPRVDEDIRQRGPNTGGGNLRPSDPDTRQTDRSA